MHPHDNVVNVVDMHVNFQNQTNIAKAGIKLGLNQAETVSLELSN